mgnify:CR=1 FL=1
MTTNSPLQDALYAALARVEDPELRRPITELGMVETALVHPELDERGEPIPGRHWAEVTVLLTIEGCPLKNTIEQQVRDAAATVEGIERVQLQVGAMNPQQRSALRSMLKPERSNPFTAPGSLTRVFGVVSGKGGVGKSSMTANLAAAFASRGLAVGIIDADVHGFSIPGLLGITDAPTRLDDLILPPTVDVPAPAQRWGEQKVSGGFIRVISIGMFLKGNEPVAWRGPMLHAPWSSSSWTCTSVPWMCYCSICRPVPAILPSPWLSCCRMRNWCSFPPRSTPRWMWRSVPAP